MFRVLSEKLKLNLYFHALPSLLFTLIPLKVQASNASIALLTLQMSIGKSNHLPLGDPIVSCVPFAIRKKKNNPAISKIMVTTQPARSEYALLISRFISDSSVAVVATCEFNAAYLWSSI